MHSTGLLAAAGALVAVAAAVPMHQQHQHLHHERDLLWVTQMEEVVVTVAVTETVWVNPGDSVPTGQPAGHGVGGPASPPAQATSVSKQDAPPAAAAAPSSSSSTYVPPPPAPTTSTSSPVAAPAAPQPTTSSTTSTSVYVAPAPTSTSTSEAPAAPAAPSSTWSPPAAAAASSPAPASSASSGKSSGSGQSSGSGLSSGLAAAGTKYNGDATYYSVGMGACGIDNTDSDHVVAISHLIFDSYGTANPNNNPTCGKTITITANDGTTYQATVVDRCTACDTGSLDFGQPFFNLVTMGEGGSGMPADGRGKVSWVWN